ncbi:hypothetical protein BKA82DRAFT_4067614 [Pisolithus tinctorius]|nr:hypothetical protein BKA82DRAFT_4067614 [Pisolithus tinctorius]
MGVPGAFGSILMGGLVSAMLYGTTTFQTYIYFMHYSGDASTVKFLVAAIWILDTLHLSCMCHALYYYLITNYGILTSLEYMVWTFPASLLINVLVIAIVQCSFAHTISCLCRPQKKWLVAGPIILLVLVHLGPALEAVIMMFVNRDVDILTQIRFSAVLPALAIVALVEALITISLCVLFHGSRSRSAFPRTKRLFQTLIIYAVNRCLLTSLVTIAEFTVNVNQQDDWTMGLDFMIGKLYANSLLASLNTRQYLRSQHSGTESAEHINTIHLGNLPQHSGDVPLSVSALGKATALRSEGEPKF